MKKNYMAPVMEIEMISSLQSIMLTLSPGQPCGEGEEVTADAKETFGSEFSLGGWE